MAAGFPEVAIGLARYASLRFGDRLNRDLRLLDQFIKTAAGNRIFAAINHRPGLHITHSRNTRLRGSRSIILANSGASASKRRMAIRAEVSRIISAALSRHREGRHDRPSETVPSDASSSPARFRAVGRRAWPHVCLSCTLLRRSRTASVTASVKLSPVSRASRWASLWASLFLMFRLMCGRCSTLYFYHSTTTGQNPAEVDGTFPLNVISAIMIAKEVFSKA